MTYFKEAKETQYTSGLIYIRARYYDPSVSRFVQIDKNYEGEKENIASQNKYVYTLNNPYKYVDRNGNWSLWGSICDVVDNVVKTVKKVAKTVTSWFKPIVNTVTEVANKISKAVTNVFDGGGSNSNSGKSGGSAVKKPTYKKVEVKAKCPEKDIKKKNDRKVFSSFQFSFDLPTINQNYGVFVLKIGKSVLSKFDMSDSEAIKFKDAGFTLNNKFDLGFDISIDSVQTLLGNLGGSFSFGSWGSLNFAINTKCDKTTFAAAYTAQTINIFANDSVELSATYKVNENVSVKNYFSVSLNKFLAAVLIVGAVVAFPVIASSFAAAGPLLAQYAAALLTAGGTGGALVFA